MKGLNNFSLSSHAAKDYLPVECLNSVNNHITYLQNFALISGYMFMILNLGMRKEFLLLPSLIQVNIVQENTRQLVSHLTFSS